MHDTVDGYEDAKARIWADLGPDRGVAVANADDPVGDGPPQPAPAARSPSASTTRPTTTSTATRWWPPTGDDASSSGTSCGAPCPTTSATRWPRRPPRSRAAPPSTACARRCARFRGLAHRVSWSPTPTACAGTTTRRPPRPHATLAAVRGFDSVVLIAGGRNKGLDLSVLAAAADHLRAVVAIGEAADEVVAAFDGRPPGA